VVTAALGLVLTGCAWGLSPVHLADRPEPAKPSTPATTTALPTAPAPLLDPHAQTIDGWPVSADGIVLRVDLHDGYERSEIISFAADGWVVRAAETDVFASTEDHTTWRLNREGLRRVLARLDALGVREARPGDFGDGAVSSYGRSAAVWFDERVISGSTPELWQAATEVTDPRWSGAAVVAPVRPWVPERIGFLAGPPDRTDRSPLGPSDRFARWPLDRGIRELSLGTMPNAYGEPRAALCLTGPDAAAVWPLLDGVNTAYLRVDDGRRWELNTTVDLPAYTRSGSPCTG
jgi:hypothetical protein